MSAITKEDLDQFKGTTTYHVFRPTTFPKVTLSDGAEYLAKQCNCLWLMDIVAQKQTLLIGEDHLSQRWQLDVKDGVGFLNCFDQHEHLILTWDIPRCNFPLEQIELCVAYDEPFSIIMLPTEYNQA